MKILLILFCVFFTSNSFAYASGEFFETLYDVPIMEGMREIPEEAVTFDKPEGRLATAAAYTDQDFEEIAAFYQLSLHQMGWQKNGLKGEKLAFRRNSEILSIFYDKSKASEGSKAVVFFQLQPVTP